MIPLPIIHKDDALARVTESFKGRPVVEGIIKAFCASLQLVDNAAFDVQSKRILANASNDALDKIGALVGEDRNGRPDSDYRLAISVRIRVNRSSGRAVDIIEITNLLVTGGKYTEGDLASFQVTATNITGAQVIVSVLSDAKPAGVHGVFAYSTWPDVTTLQRSSTVGAVGYLLRNSTVGSVSFSGLRISCQDITS